MIPVRGILNSADLPEGHENFEIGAYGQCLLTRATNRSSSRATRRAKPARVASNDGFVAKDGSS
jgi:hypothetical protein